MTANQINYAKLKEESRHNRVSERHEHQDVATRRYQASTAAFNAQETQRHNQEQERVNWWSARETQRHNQEQESANWFNIRTTTAETERHNRQTEDIQSRDVESQSQFRRDTAWAQLMQATQAGRANEIAAQNAQTQKIRAESDRMNAETNRMNATTRQSELSASISAVRQNVGLGYSQLQESTRHNLANELETRVHNRNTEHEITTNNWLTRSEDQRHNLASESVAQQNADTNAMNARTNRTNAATNRKQADIASRNATSNRITAVSKAFDSAVNVARTAGNFVGGVYFG